MDIPQSDIDLFAMQNDNAVETRTFSISDMSLSAMEFRLDIQKPDDTKGIVYLDKTVTDKEILLTWEIVSGITDISGYLAIQLRAFNPSGVEVWHSVQRSLKVHASINAADAFPDPLPPEFTQMEQRVAVLKNATEDAAADARGSKTDAETARNAAQGFATQTAQDRQAVGQDRTAVANDKQAVNTALTNFSNTTLPATIQSVADKANTEITRMGQAGNLQVEAVEQAGAEQITLATEQADRSKGEADRSQTEATKSRSYAVGDTGSRPGEADDNAKKYKEIAQQVMTDILNMLGTDIPMLVGGKIPPPYLPATATTEIYSVSSIDELTALVAQKGDYAHIIEVVDGVPTIVKTYQLLSEDSTVLSNWVVWGTSYAVTAGTAQMANNALNAEMINGKRLVKFNSLEEFLNAVRVDGTLYVVRRVSGG